MSGGAQYSLRLYCNRSVIHPVDQLRYVLDSTVREYCTFGTTVFVHSYTFVPADQHSLLVERYVLIFAMVKNVKLYSTIACTNFGGCFFTFFKSFFKEQLALINLDVFKCSGLYILHNQ